MGIDVRFTGKGGGTEHRGWRRGEMMDVFGYTWKNIRTTEHFFFFFWQRGTILSSYLETLSLQWSWDSGQAEPELRVGGAWRQIGSCQAVVGVTLVSQTGKNLPAMQETWVRSLGWEDPLEKGVATCSSILGWRIPWSEEPSRLYIVHGVSNNWTWPSNWFFFYFQEVVEAVGWAEVFQGESEVQR